jgi:hypothetical protein
VWCEEEAARAAARVTDAAQGSNLRALAVVSMVGAPLPSDCAGQPLKEGFRAM